jgi:hypothetical protein
MSRSKIYEKIIHELRKIDKINSFFKRSDLSELINKHQKFSSFLYKHSDKNNKGKMVLYFDRKYNINHFIYFKVNNEIYKEYFK